MEIKEHVFNWNEADMPESDKRPIRGLKVEFQDETGRDGIQGSYVKQFTIEEFKRLILIDNELGIKSINGGYPGSSEAQFNRVVETAKFIRDRRLNLNITCAGRTDKRDIEPIIRASEMADVPMEVGVFIRSSDIGTLAQPDWTPDIITQKIRENIVLARRSGVSVMFVAEDSTRATPAMLKRVYRVAIEVGAQRICVADTVGYIEPEGVSKLFKYIKDEVIQDSGVSIDWHGHNDTDQATANALMAIRCGASRVHGVWLGVGERAGNVALDTLLVLLKDRGADINIENHEKLGIYVPFIASMLNYRIPPNYPFFGKDVFSTQTGTHASAIEKAESLHVNGLAGLVYSPIHPRDIGRDYDIEIGPMSGASNVRMKLSKIGKTTDPKTVIAILNFAKSTNRLLADEEIEILCNQSKSSGEQI